MLDYVGFVILGSIPGLYSELLLDLFTIEPPKRPAAWAKEHRLRFHLLHLLSDLCLFVHCHSLELVTICLVILAPDYQHEVFDGDATIASLETVLLMEHNYKLFAY